MMSEAKVSAELARLEALLIEKKQEPVDPKRDPTGVQKGLIQRGRERPGVGARILDLRWVLGQEPLPPSERVLR
jgi:hypothetical protein